MAQCPACGATVDSDTVECPDCGARVAGATAEFEAVTSVDDAAQIAGPNQSDGPVLVVRKGPQTGERFFLDRASLTIGRDPASDIFLNDMTVSRTHAVVSMVGSTVSVADSGSLNGTYVNGVLVDGAQLESGDVVQIGMFQMAFYCAAEGGRS